MSIEIIMKLNLRLKLSPSWRSVPFLLLEKGAKALGQARWFYIIIIIIGSRWSHIIIVIIGSSKVISYHHCYRRHIVIIIVIFINIVNIVIIPMQGS